MKNFVTQEDRLDYLLQEFKEDSGQYKDLEVEDDYESKRMALRSLMNIRMPGKMAENIIKVQDEFLRLEAEEKGIVAMSDIMTIKEQYGSNHPVHIIIEQFQSWQNRIPGHNALPGFVFHLKHSAAVILY